MSTQGIKSIKSQRLLLHAVFLGIVLAAFIKLMAIGLPDCSFFSLDLLRIGLLLIPICVVLSIIAVSRGGQILYRGLFVGALVFSIYTTLAAFVPGVYATDQMEELYQAVTGDYHDYQPPLMPWVWSLLLRATGDPVSLLYFHLLLLVGAACCWARVLERLHAEPAILVLPLLILSPPIVSLSGFMSIDVGFAYTMLISSGIAGLVLIEQRVRQYQLWIVAIIVIYSIGVRWNGIFSVLPIVGVVTWQTLRTLRVDISRRKLITTSIAIPIAYIILTTVGLNILYYGILRTQKSYIFQVPQLFDIAGISVRSGKDYFPAYIKNQPTHDMSLISAKYTSSCNPLFWPPAIPQTNKRKKRSEITRSWLKSIYEEPGAYFDHRIFIWSDLMTGSMFSYIPPQQSMESISIMSEQYQSKVDLTKVIQYHSIPGSTTAIQWVTSIQNKWKETFLFRGWFWTALLFLEFMLGCFLYKKLQSGRILLLLSTSALFYVLPQFVVIPSPEVRYLYWSNIAACFAAVVFLSDLTNWMVDNIKKRIASK